MALFRLLLGIGLLIMGRRLFWLFLGVVGFAFGFDFAERTIHGLSHDVILIIALVSGALGAMVAIFLQKFAVIGGGFFAGGYLLVELLKAFGISTANYHWLIFIVGGLVGALLMRAVFGWALIILSSILGATLILQSFHLGQDLTAVLFICLVILGIGIQFGLIRKISPSRGE
ncbi:MAG TPA: hypothetical protein VK435_06475 [Thermodesulfovibrionales bacterium]|nr:hypothetical protein [Thermodesulfovibrionales bacterium]